jgi:hypothetical protein
MIEASLRHPFIIHVITFQKFTVNDNYCEIQRFNLTHVGQVRKPTLYSLKENILHMKKVLFLQLSSVFILMTFTK